MQVGLNQVLPRDSLHPAVQPTDLFPHLLSLPSPGNTGLLQFHRHTYIHVALMSTECYSCQTKDTYSNLVHRCFISDINTVCIVRFSYMKEKFVVQQKLR